MEASKFADKVQETMLPDGEIVPEFRSTVRRSPELDKLLPALIKAQKEFGPIVKGKENDAYTRGQKKSKYADLAAVVDATLPHLNAYGLTIVQHVQGHHVTRETVVTTTLFHESGQFLESDLTVPSTNQQGRFDPQTVASGSTYARRYAWLGITGTAPEDDDGNAASGVGKTAEAEKKANGSVPKAQIPTGPIEASPKLNLPPVPPAAAPEPESKSGEDIDYIQGIVKRVVDKQTKDKRLYKEVGILDPLDRSLTLCSFDNFQLSDGRFWQYLTPSIVDEVATFVVARREKNGKAYHNIINVEMIGNHKWENGVGVMDRANS